MKMKSLNFGPLGKISLSFSFRMILSTPVITWPHGAYRNAEPEQIQGRGFWEILLKSKLLQKITLMTNSKFCEDMLK